MANAGGLFGERTNNASEYLRMIHGEIREGFSVELDFRLFESTDEFGVGHIEFANSCIDAEGPEISVLTLFRTAVSKGVGPGVSNSFVSNAFLGGSVKAIALGLRKDVLAPLYLHCSSFYACHILLWEEPASVRSGHIKHLEAAATHSSRTALFSIKMVMPRGTGNDLTVLRHP